MGCEYQLHPEHGIQINNRERPDDLASIDSVDTLHSTIVVLEGPPDGGAVLRAFDAESGSHLWQKAGLRLNRWRPFLSYVAAGQPEAYYSQVVGSAVLVWLADSGSADLGPCSGRLVAFDLRDGRGLITGPVG
jgi:hypothetical protein